MHACGNLNSYSSHGAVFARRTSSLNRAPAFGNYRKSPVFVFQTLHGNRVRHSSHHALIPGNPLTEFAQWFEGKNLAQVDVLEKAKYV